MHTIMFKVASYIKTSDVTNDLAKARLPTGLVFGGGGGPVKDTNTLPCIRHAYIYTLLEGVCDLRCSALQ